MLFEAADRMEELVTELEALTAVTAKNRGPSSMEAIRRDAVEHGGSLSGAGDSQLMYFPLKQVGEEQYGKRLVFLWLMYLAVMVL